MKGRNLSGPRLTVHAVHTNATHHARITVAPDQHRKFAVILLEIVLAHECRVVSLQCFIIEEEALVEDWREARLPIVRSAATTAARHASLQHVCSYLSVADVHVLVTERSVGRRTGGSSFLCELSADLADVAMTPHREALKGIGDVSGCFTKGAPVSRGDSFRTSADASGRWHGTCSRRW